MNERWLTEAELIEQADRSHSSRQIKRLRSAGLLPYRRVRLGKGRGTATHYREQAVMNLRRISELQDGGRASLDDLRWELWREGFIVDLDRLRAYLLGALEVVSADICRAIGVDDLTAVHDVEEPAEYLDTLTKTLQKRSPGSFGGQFRRRTKNGSGTRGSQNHEFAMYVLAGAMLGVHTFDRNEAIDTNCGDDTINTVLAHGMDVPVEVLHSVSFATLRLTTMMETLRRATQLEFSRIQQTISQLHDSLSLAVELSQGAEIGRQACGLLPIFNPLNPPERAALVAIFIDLSRDDPLQARRINRAMRNALNDTDRVVG